MDVWLEFLGYYISEGHTTIRERNRYQSCISQNKGAKRDKIKQCIDKLPIKYWENEDGFWFSNCQFGRYLAVLGKSPDKFIYNKKKLQVLKDGINTCGRWVILRIMMFKTGYDLESFINFIDKYCINNDIPSDIAVVQLTS